MTNNPIARWVAVGAGIVLALGLTTGCGSTKSKTDTASPLGAAGLPTSTNGLGNDGSVDAKVCAAIATDVAAIVKNVSNPKTYPGQCAFDGGATTITFDINDPNHSGVIDVLGNGAHPISGFGDHAVWDDANGEVVPTFGAYKGNVSCLIQPDSEVENDTVTFTGAMPFIKISDSDGAAYAQKMGAVCDDVFGAIG